MSASSVLTTDGLHFLTDVDGEEKLGILAVVLIISHYIISGK